MDYCSFSLYTHIHISEYKIPTQLKCYFLRIAISNLASFSHPKQKLFVLSPDFSITDILQSSKMALNDCILKSVILYSPHPPSPLNNFWYHCYLCAAFLCKLLEGGFWILIPHFWCLRAHPLIRFIRTYLASMLGPKLYKILIKWNYVSRCDWEIPVGRGLFKPLQLLVWYNTAVFAQGLLTKTTPCIFFSLFQTSNQFPSNSSSSWIISLMTYTDDLSLMFYLLWKRVRG